MSELPTPGRGEPPATFADVTVRTDGGAPPAEVAAAGAVGHGSVLDGRYRLEELIGSGGTATVYRGTDTLLDRQVAVKVFHAHLADRATVGRQRQEMQIVARLRHPNLVLLHDARNSTDQPAYLVLEFERGPTLGRRIEDGPLAPDAVARIGAGIADALETVHANGLVHRDVKPANILLGADGEAKLSDFGIARVVDAERITSSADVVGTACYMSPEQARGGTVGAASDIYALGLVLLEALTGQREFPGAPVAAAVARLLRDPVIPDSLPADWPPLLRGMTAMRPDDRPSAAEVAARLRTLRDGDRAAGAEAVVGRPHRTSQRAVLVGSGIAATILAAVATFGVLSRSDDESPASVPGAGSTTVVTVEASPVAGATAPARGAPKTAAAEAALQSGRAPNTAATRSAPATRAAAAPATAAAPAAPTVRAPTATAPAVIAPAQQPAPDPTAVPPAASEPAQPEPAEAPPANGNGNGNGNNGNGNNGNGNNGNGNNGNGNGNGNNGNGNNGNGNGKPPKGQ